MELFKRTSAPGPGGPLPTPPLGSGRRLRSGLAAADCLGTLEALLLGYRAPRYRHLPPYVEPGWVWNPAARSPDAVVSCYDGNDDFLLAAFWEIDGGTELGLFPLGSGDERLQRLSIVGNWKMRDPSLASIGVVPPAAITLCAPRLADDYVEEIVVAAGFPPAPVNVQLTGAKIGEMFLIKAHQFLTAQDAELAARFVDGHRLDDGPCGEYCQALLEDLADHHPGLVPYIQDLPSRIRAILLYNVETEGIFWRQLAA